MIHGTGGGFDQGLSFTEDLVPHGVRVIAPSRFGYLGSDFPPQPSSERQADALAQLLDHLNIRKAAVGGGSAGALSAVQFALRYPERTSALVLIVPAANVRDRDPVEMSAVQKMAGAPPDDLRLHVLGGQQGGSQADDPDLACDRPYTGRAIWPARATAGEADPR